MNCSHLKTVLWSLAATIVFCAMFGNPVRAAERDWVYGGAGEWDWSAFGMIPPYGPILCPWSDLTEPTSVDPAYFGRVAEGGSLDGRAVVTEDEHCLSLHTGYDAGSNNTIRVNGGTLNVGLQYHIGYGGTATHIQESGTTDVGNNLQMGDLVGSHGILNLQGGLLESYTSFFGNHGEATINHSGGTYQTRGVRLGVYADGQGDYFLSGNGNLVSTDDILVGGYGQGSFSQSGGALVQATAVILGSTSTGSGSYRLDGGQLNINDPTDLEYLYVGRQGSGVFTQNGGQIVKTGVRGINIYLGDDPGATGTYHLNGGQVTSSLLDVGRSGTGTFNQNGGTNTVNTAVYIGERAGAEGEYNFYGGNLTGPGELYVRLNAGATGRFQGNGVVSLTGSLTNNGRIVANGAGAEVALDLRAMSQALNTVDNDADNGWYATNLGQLILPRLAIASGPGAYNWGESQTDTDIDLVNSVRIEFGDVLTGGTLTIALDDPARSDVPAGIDYVAGVWYFDAVGGLDFTEADVTFRYDDALVASLGLTEDDLRVFHFDDVASVWEDITSAIDTAGNHIYAYGVDSFSFFAVGANDPPAVPEPASVVLFGIGLVCMGGFVRRKRSA